VVTARDPSGAEATDTFTWTVLVSLPVTVTVKDFKFVPKGVTAALGQVVRWTFQGPSVHTATDSIGLGAGTAALFDSGPRGPGETYEFAFGAAGNYPYGSTLHPMTGTVRVPVTVSPTSGTTATQFTLQWATSSMPGYHFSVQYRFRPQGSGTWTKWLSLGAPQTAPSGAFVPDQGAGTYEFRSRLQNDATGRMSPFSVAASITVS
jgi:plastocyanin